MKVGEPELARLYEYDLALAETVESLAVRIQSLPGTAGEPAVRSVLEAAEEADRMFDGRATVFEDVTQKGGR